MTWCPQPLPDLYTPEQIEAAKDMSNALRWSQERLDQYLSEKATRLRAEMESRVLTAAVQDKVANPKPFRSKWEEQYNAILAAEAYAGLIGSYSYECITLVLPGKVRYTPDFLVVGNDGQVCFHEVKGRMREGANRSLRQAIDVYPYFHFYIVGGDMIPRRMFTPGDVPATTRSKK